MSEISKEILDLLESSEKPLSSREIAEKLPYYSRASLLKSLKKLAEEKQIQSYSAMTAKGDSFVHMNYYSKLNDTKDSSIKNVENLIDELNQKYVNLDSDLQVKNDELNKRIEEVENNTKNIYLNIISIISVFIAIFTLIITDVEVLKEYISVDDTVCDVIAKMAVINIPLVIVIFFMLLMIRCMILKSLKSKQRKKESKE